MGKKKGQGPKRVFKKDPVATKIAGVKKTRTKAVVTNLKKMTFKTKSKTEDLDAQFAELQSQTTSGVTLLSRKPTASGSPHTQGGPETAPTKSTYKQKEEPDMDMAVEELSKLTS